MENSPVKLDFTVPEVVALTGFSKYMLDYLVREEIFAPSGSTESRRGMRRRYTYTDVVLLRALHSICAGKGKIRHLRQALSKFRKEFGQIAPKQRLRELLFVQGDELCAYTPGEGGRQLRSGQLTFSFVVDLAAVSQQIADCLVVNAKTRRLSLSPSISRIAEKERQRVWESIRARRSR